MLVLGLPQVRVGEPRDSVLDALHLAGHDGQHLNGDAVELIEAAPGSDLGETFGDREEEKRREVRTSARAIRMYGLREQAVLH